MTFIYWIVFGLIAGGIANFISPSSQGGIIGSIILGIIGAVVGGYLGQRFFGVGGNRLQFDVFCCGDSRITDRTFYCPAIYA